MPVQLGLFPGIPRTRQLRQAAGLRVAALQSGSEGNATLVAAGETRLLVDCGISPSRLRERLSQHGLAPEQLSGILVTHEHADHAGGCGVVSRRWGIPLHMTEGTALAARERILRRKVEQEAVRLLPREGRLAFRDGKVVDPGGEHDLQVEWLPVPHDAAQPVAFVLERAGMRFGVFTDLGHASRAVKEVLGTLDGALLELNHEAGMLDAGPYPDSVKRRIASSRGHLSNAQAARLVRGHASPRLRFLLVGHVSAVNNTLDLALTALRGALAHRPDLEVELHTAHPDRSTAVVEL